MNGWQLILAFIAGINLTVFFITGSIFNAIMALLLLVALYLELYFDV